MRRSNLNNRGTGGKSKVARTPQINLEHYISSRISGKKGKISPTDSPIKIQDVYPNGDPNEVKEDIVENPLRNNRFAALATDDEDEELNSPIVKSPLKRNNSLSDDSDGPQAEARQRGVFDDLSSWVDNRKKLVSSWLNKKDDFHKKTNENLKNNPPSPPKDPSKSSSSSSDSNSSSSISDLDSLTKIEKKAKKMSKKEKERLMLEEARKDRSHAKYNKRICHPKLLVSYDAEDAVKAAAELMEQFPGVYDEYVAPVQGEDRIDWLSRVALYLYNNNDNFFRGHEANPLNCRDNLDFFWNNQTFFKVAMKPQYVLVKSMYGFFESSCPDEDAYYSPSSNVFIGNITGTIYPAVEENSVVPNAISSGLGWVKVLDKDTEEKPVVARGLIGEHETADGKINGKYYRSEKYHYYRDLVKDLRKQFPTANVPEHVINAYISSISKSTRNRDILTGTIRHLAICKSDNYFMATGSQDFARATEGLVTNEHEWLIYTQNNEASYVRTPILVDPRECEMPFDWESRNDYKASCSWLPFEEPDILDWSNVEFPTMHVDPGHKMSTKWKVHTYFALHGERSFSTFDNTPNNMLRAVKRMVAQRDADEDEYVRNQAHLTISLCSRILTSKTHKVMSNNLKPMLKTLNCSYNQYHRKLSIDENSIDEDGYQNRSFTFKQENAYSSFMTTGITRFISDCNREFVQRWVDRYKTSKHWAYYKGFDTFLTAFSSFFSREYNANIVHVKRKLRQAYVNGVLLHDDNDIMTRRLNACVKRELAKPGKVPRLFVSYDAGCMYANELPEFMKAAIDGSHIHHLNGCVFQQVIIGKPRAGVIEEMFKQLIDSINHDNYIMHLIYSDDSVMAGKINGIPFTYNLDISASDSTIRQLTFLVTGLCLSNFHRDRANGLVKQCTLPIYLENPYERTERIKIQFDSVFCGSGSVLTTILNHVHDMIGGLSAFFHLATYKPINEAEISEHIVKGYKKAGIKVTTADCFLDGNLVPEKIQFLKQSPMRTISGKYVPSTNLGCLLRSLGSVDDAMTPEKLCVTPERFNTMSYSERMDIFWSIVVKGLVHEPGNIILDALRFRFNTQVNSEITGHYLIDNLFNFEEDEKLARDEFGHAISETDYSKEYVTMESLCARYECSPQELVELSEDIRRLRFGMVKYVPVITNIMKVDYDL